MSASRRRLLTGWANTAPTAAHVRTPADAPALADALRDVDARGIVARGLARSYGDAAQNAGGTVIDTTGVSGIVDLDLRTGTVTVLAGTSIDELIRCLVPLGWFVPVTPGTRQVTVGGAIASDVHGKNHHHLGSFCDSVQRLTIVTPAGGLQSIGPDQDPDLFWATAGGMGLTGLIIDATILLRPVETSLLAVDTDRTPDLDATLDLMASSDDQYSYSVAWIDLMSTGRSLGRSVLDRGDFATVDQLPASARDSPRRFRSGTLATFPPIPAGLINWASAKAFNELWYRRAPRRRRNDLQSISQFFHPLDGVDRWNRVYGPRGLLQWQCAVPPDATDTLQAVIERIATSAKPSFLAVLKRFGPGNPGPLSFPIGGWTLALDLPATATAELRTLLDGLDELVVGAGGRLYLAKDSRMRPELIEAMYPRLDAWRTTRDRADPDRLMASDLSRRLGLIGAPEPGGGGRRTQDAARAVSS